MFYLLLLSLFNLVYSTPSVWQCPINMFGPMSPLNPQMGQVCPGPTFLSYYACCQGDPFACCFYLEPWFIVVIIVLGFLGGTACLFAIGGALLRRKRREQEEQHY